MALSLQKQPPLWRRVQRTNFSSLKELSAYLELSEQQEGRLLDARGFVLNLPRRLAEKMAKKTLEDPLFKQFVPLQEEAIVHEGFSAEPVQDSCFRKSPKLLHKYQGRALIITTSACAMHCRYCFRQNFPYEIAEKGFEQELELIAQDPSLSEVLLSGGDPLSLSDAALQKLLEGLAKIPHIQRVRFHTRFLIGIPERIDSSFLSTLAAFPKQIVFVIHVNHPLEIDQDVVEVLNRLHKQGVILLNQSVLLKGVNDEAQTLIGLSEALVAAKVVPYYLHLLDPVQGSGHFYVSDEKGIELLTAMQKSCPGYAVPRLAREEPGKPSKTWIA